MERTRTVVRVTLGQAPPSSRKQLLPNVEILVGKELFWGWLAVSHVGTDHAAPWDMIAPPHLIVGYDGSPLSDAALARAFRLLAHERFAMVHVVTVAQPDGDQVRLPSGEKMHLWSALQTLRHIIEATTMDDCADKEHVRVVAHVLLGEPAATLVDFSYRYHATRIFLGARGLSSKGLEVGSVAAEVLALSEIPVHLESPLPSSSSIPPCGRTFGHELRGQSLFGPKLPPWRSPALA